MMKTKKHMHLMMMATVVVISLAVKKIEDSTVITYSGRIKDPLDMDQLTQSRRRVIFVLCKRYKCKKLVCLDYGIKYKQTRSI